MELKTNETFCFVRLNSVVRCSQFNQAITITTAMECFASRFID